MDLYAKTCGKPAILTVDIEQTREGGRDPLQNPPLKVSVLDPATGNVETMPQPPYETPENEAFWRPVLTELRKRLEKRGWFDVTAIQHVDYARPPWKEVVSSIKRIWPDGRWLSCAHPVVTRYAAMEKDSYMPVPYVEYVWGGVPYNPDHDGQPYGRPFLRYPRAWTNGPQSIIVGNPRYGMGFVREGFRPWSSLAEHRFVVEGAVQANVRGMGRVGGDSWPLPLGKEGGLVSLFDAFGAVGPGENTVALFSPGPDGAAFNTRTEMFREGVQAAEAIAFLQRAVEEKRVDNEVARRIEELLDERARYYLRGSEFSRIWTLWYGLECSNWQERDDKLFALCAEVAKAEKK